ncbi:MAG: DNA-binding protein [Burkholderiaceae bacterium]|nr:DNA-binding protein [Burkholderiaceae bacterium]
MSSRIKTPPQVRAEFARKGISISSWAKQHGFSRQAAHAVLSGRLQCRYGASHRIAVLLGLKEGEIS